MIRCARMRSGLQRCSQHGPVLLCRRSVAHACAACLILAPTSRRRRAHSGNAAPVIRGSCGSVQVTMCITWLPTFSGSFVIGPSQPLGGDAAGRNACRFALARRARWCSCRTGNDDQTHSMHSMHSIPQTHDPGYRRRRAGASAQRAGARSVCCAVHAADVICCPGAAVAARVGWRVQGGDKSGSRPDGTRGGGFVGGGCSARVAPSVSSESAPLHVRLQWGRCAPGSQLTARDCKMSAPRPGLMLRARRRLPHTPRRCATRGGMRGSAVL